MACIIHTADWQIGMTRHFFSDEEQARYTDARLSVIEAIGQLARKKNAEAVLVCGDVFESNFIGPKILWRALEAMAAIPAPVYLLPGNHDPLDAASVFRSSPFLDKRSPNVFVVESNAPIIVRPGLELVGAPWRNKKPTCDLITRALADLPPPDGFRIALAHGVIDTLNPDRENPAVISSSKIEELIAKGHLHYLALGDRHSVTSIGASGRIWYSGTPEVTDFDEVMPGYALSADFVENQLKVEKHSLGQWQFKVHEAYLSSDADIKLLDETLHALPAKSQTVLKLLLRGTITLEQKVVLDALCEHYAAIFASLQHWERHTDLAVRPNDTDFSQMRLTGFAQTALTQLLALAPSSETAQDALSLLYRLSVSQPYPSSRKAWGE